MREMPEVDREAYAALSGMAVTALVLGLLSVTALIDPLALLVPLCGVVVGAWSLVRLARREGELTGRKAALAGLLLSILLGSVAAGQWVTHRRLLQAEARKVGAAWFERMAKGQPQLAHQLTLNPDSRQSSGEDSWAPYRENRGLHDELEKQLADKLFRVLLALGEKATVRFYATEVIDRTTRDEVVVMLFVVTFDGDAGKKSFLVRVAVKRTPTEMEGRVPWKIMGLTGGVRPAWEVPLD